MLGGLLTSFTTLCRGHVYWEAYLPVLPLSVEDMYVWEAYLPVSPLSVEDMYIGRLTYQFYHSL